MGRYVPCIEGRLAAGITPMIGHLWPVAMVAAIYSPSAAGAGACSSSPSCPGTWMISGAGGSTAKSSNRVCRSLYVLWSVCRSYLLHSWILGYTRWRVVERKKKETRLVDARHMKDNNSGIPPVHRRPENSSFCLWMFGDPSDAHICWQFQFWAEKVELMAVINTYTRRLRLHLMVESKHRLAASLKSTILDEFYYF